MTDDTTRDRVRALVRDVLATALPAEEEAAGGSSSPMTTSEGSTQSSSVPTRFINTAPEETSGPQKEFARDESSKMVITEADVRGLEEGSRLRIAEGAHLTPLAADIVRELAGVRIGVFGLGISPVGLITPENFKGITYHDPVKVSRGAVRVLRERERCAMVLCASHLGYYPNPKGEEIGDTQVAAQVDGIDFIASGHTHTFMQQPVVVKTPAGGETIIFQVGKSGIYLGRVDFTVKQNKVTAYAGKLLDLRDA